MEDKFEVDDKTMEIITRIFEIMEINERRLDRVEKALFQSKRKRIVNITKEGE